MACGQNNSNDWIDKCPNYNHYLYGKLLAISIKSGVTNKFNLNIYKQIGVKYKELIDGYVRNDSFGYIPHSISQIITIFYSPSPSSSAPSSTVLSQQKDHILHNFCKIKKGIYSNNKAVQSLSLSNIYQILSIESLRSTEIKSIYDDNKFISHLIKLLNPSINPCFDLQYKCLWILAKIINSTKTNLPFSVNNGIISQCVHLLKTTSSYMIKKQLIWIFEAIISNLKPDEHDDRDDSHLNDVLSDIISIYKLPTDGYYDHKPSHSLDLHYEYMTFLESAAMTLCSILSCNDGYKIINEFYMNDVFKWMSFVLFHLKTIENDDRYKYLTESIQDGVAESLLCIKDQCDDIDNLWKKMNEYNISKKVIDLYLADCDDDDDDIQY